MVEIAAYVIGDRQRVRTKEPVPAYALLYSLAIRTIVSERRRALDGGVQDLAIYGCREGPVILRLTCVLKAR